ncbi:MAG: hypothetical protein HGB23_02890 [Chlorobiaceae bacterium]|nr:hypothetical protein [Chlorobiaceae bacterium]
MTNLRDGVHYCQKRAHLNGQVSSAALCFRPLKIESATCAGNPVGHGHFYPV